jgi:hypothetical protein
MDIFLITSVIDTCNKPLSYSSRRSVYTCEERLNQTVETIQSIKKYVPNAYIVLIDGSGRLLTSQEKLLLDGVNNIIEITDEASLQDIQNKYKAIGECRLILNFLNSPLFKSLQINRFFKISGRYHLQEGFNINDFLSDKISIRAIRMQYNTVVVFGYSISNNYLDFFKNRIQDIYNTYESRNPMETSLEDILFYDYNDTKIYHLVDKLYIGGYVAVAENLYWSY